MNIILFGPPGSGKTTQAELLREHQGYNVVSMGQLLRNEMHKQTTIGIQVTDIISKGNLVPDNICMDLLQGAIKSADPIVFDGFPRSEQQLQALPAEYYPFIIIALNADYQILYDRLIHRHRHDDTPTTIKNRYNVYQTHTIPLVDKLQDRYNIHNIDANQDRLDVYQAIESTIGV